MPLRYEASCKEVVEAMFFNFPKLQGISCFLRNVVRETRIISGYLSCLSKKIPLHSFFGKRTFLQFTLFLLSINEQGDF